MFTGAISFTPPTPDRIRLVHEGVTRTYRVWAPRPIRNAQPPILLLFHGWSSSAEKIAASSALPEAAAARGWLVIAPQGSGSPARWALPGRLDGPDDVAFVERVVADAARRWNADPSRVAAAGFSNGAAFAALLACRAPLVGVALVGGAGFGRPCATATPRPIALVHGESDHVVRMGGGTVLGGRLQAMPFVDAVLGWTATGASVDAVTVKGWGHTWPPEATAATLRMLAATFAV